MANIFLVSTRCRKTAKFENREKSGHILGGKHAITSFSLTYKTSTVSSFVKGSKRTNRTNFYFELISITNH